MRRGLYIVNTIERNLRNRYSHVDVYLVSAMASALSTILILFDRLCGQNPSQPTTTIKRTLCLFWGGNAYTPGRLISYFPCSRNAPLEARNIPFSLFTFGQWTCTIFILKNKKHHLEHCNFICTYKTIAFI